MANFDSALNFFRRLIGIQTKTPPWSLSAFLLMNETGQLAAYADPATGALRAGPASGATQGTLIPNQQTPANQIVTSASGAVVVQNSTVVITKTGTLAALTLALPTTAQNGTQIQFTSMTAFAHTITCPSAIVNNGVTGDPFTVITLAAFAGGGVTLQAYNGFWNVVANVLSTFA